MVTTQMEIFRMRHPKFRVPNGKPLLLFYIMIAWSGITSPLPIERLCLAVQLWFQMVSVAKVVQKAKVLESLKPLCHRWLLGSSDELTLNAIPVGVFRFMSEKSGRGGGECYEVLTWAV
ncbi:uncharacterized protein [Elaeis guineensis]|uniref:uncharacterized protein isoform X2 n=1 Tax=Elaeis guineensis var. tenera TaxID=51953 RepID=UPI003C6D2AC5